MADDDLRHENTPASTPDGSGRLSPNGGGRRDASAGEVQDADGGAAAWRDNSDGGIRAAWSVDAVRAAEEATGDDFTDGALMQRAARGLADIVRREVAELERRGVTSPRVVVLVGPGNNGGDALYAARDLAVNGIECLALLVADKAHVEGVAAARAAGVDVARCESASHSGAEPEGGGRENAHALAHADLVVDGILGIGADPGRASTWQELADLIPIQAFVVAVDCPTPGFRADITVTFGEPKTSLMLAPAANGRVEVVDIGIHLPLGEQEAMRLSGTHLAHLWPVPGPRDHKYTRGVVGLATGSDAFPGAAVLGAVAAVTAGAGMVRYVGPRRAEDAVTAATPEVVHGSGRVQAWVVGSGIDGPSEREHESDRYDSAMAALRSEEPVVIDAGALTWFEPGVRPEGAQTVITPHAGELATLLQSRDIDVERSTIEADPVTWARRAANETGATVLLKGGVTVIASSGEGPVTIENRAPHWLATAGTGDVLAALLGVLLAAGLEPRSAAALAAYTHGRAAHLANPDGPVRALDVATSLGRVASELVAEQRRVHEERRAGRFPR